MTRKVLHHAALAAAIGSISSGAFAAGFALQETSISGLGRAFAAENTIGDNASILARNPAGSALFKNIELSGGLIYVNPEIDATGDVTFFLTPQLPRSFKNQKARDYASTAWVPNAYLAVPFNDTWSAGLSLYSNYGLETNFKSNALTAAIAKQTKLITVNIAPSLAYDFNDTFSIGIAANILYADAKLNNQVPSDFPVIPRLSDSSVLNIKGHAWKVSWSIGALWHIADRTHAGVSYHAKLDPKLQGKVSSDLIPPQQAPFNKAKGNLTVDLPPTLELGFYHQFSDHWSLALGATWTDWDVFKRLDVYIPGQTIEVPDPNDPTTIVTIQDPAYNPLTLREENFKSGWRYSIGGEFSPCEEVTWRIGYAYDKGAARNGLLGIDEDGFPITLRNLSIPDSDRQWVTFGGTYQVNKQLSLDAGIAYLWGKDKPILEATLVPVPTFYEGGTTRVEAWLFGGALNYSF